VLLIDDHQHARDALAQRLSREADLLVESAPASAPELLAKKLEWSPAIIFIDVKTTLSDGIGICRELKQAQPDSKILVLTSFVSQQETNELKAAGAEDVFVKDLDVSELLRVIRGSSASNRSDSERK